MNWPTVEKNVPIPPRQNLVHKRRDKLKWVQKNMQEDDSFLCDSLEEAQNWVLTINLCEGYTLWKIHCYRIRNKRVLLV